jgi:hypothetical protein
VQLDPANGQRTPFAGAFATKNVGNLTRGDIYDLDLRLSFNLDESAPTLPQREGKQLWQNTIADDRDYLRRGNGSRRLAILFAKCFSKMILR